VVLLISKRLDSKGRSSFYKEDGAMKNKFSITEKTATCCALATLLIGCSQSSFNGADKSGTPPPAADQDADANSMDSDSSTHSNSMDGNDIPTNAVSKGSFMVYTVPATPRPREDYKIHIMVSLPQQERVSYTSDDLSGNIVGTDGFRYVISSGMYQGVNKQYYENPASFPGFERYKNIEEFRYYPEKNRARLIVLIPGAAKMVKDTITISSHLLQESQTIDLVFNDSAW
jgi:hypothetical protein